MSYIFKTLCDWSKQTGLACVLSHSGNSWNLQGRTASSSKTLIQAGLCNIPWVVASWWVVVYRSTAANNKSSSNGSFKYKNFECSSVSSRSFRYVKTTKWWLQCRHAVNEYLASRLVNQKMTSIAQMRVSNMLVPPKSHHLIVSPILFESFFVSLFHCNYFLLKTLERWKRYYEM